MPARHLFVCTNLRSSGKPACGRRGGDALVTAVQHALLRRGGDAIDALVTPCGCLGPCFDGPNAVIYPDGAWYAELNGDDAEALADHLVDGTPHHAKISRRPGLESPVQGDTVNPDNIADDSAESGHGSGEEV